MVATAATSATEAPNLRLVSTSHASRRELKGITKAAALLVALGPEASSKVLQTMTEHEIEALSVRIAELHGPTPEEADQLLSAAYEATPARHCVPHGGGEFAQHGLRLGPVREQAAAVL